jgi:uncharacterized protein (TIGR03382 family)
VLDRLPTWLVDAVIAAVVVVSAIGNVVQDGPFFGALAVAAAAAVFWRRRWPLGLLAFVTVIEVVLAVAGQSVVLGPDLVAFAAVGDYVPRRRGVPAAAAALVAISTAAAATGHASALAAAIGLVVAWLLGDNLRARRERNEAEARQAVADERARIARELHDVVTHNVSVMVVQAAAGNDVFDERPDQAREALGAIEQTGRQALGELRRLLDVVAADNAPQPGLDEIDTLVDQVRRAGVHVDLAVEGTPRPLPPALDLSAYRILQESLTNMLKHARATRASVRVTYRDRAVELDVIDDGVGGASAANGRGLVGMRERVALFNGDLDAGPRPGGGFAVHASLPVETT